MAEIESGALDSDADLPKLLRTCIALGGSIGTADLRDWASRELKGYGPDDDLPEYRRIPAPLMLDGFTGSGRVTGIWWTLSFFLTRPATFSRTLS